MLRGRIHVDSLEHHPSPNDDEHDPDHHVLGAADDAGANDHRYPA
jgi:hypothetical protein